MALNPFTEPGPNQSGREANMDPRLAVITRVEWAVLAICYVAYLALVACHAAGFTPNYIPGLVLTTLVLLLRAGWTHYVFYTHRYKLFVSPANLVVHLASVTILVALTGTENSPFSWLFIVVIIGYCAYTPEFLNTWLVTVLCCGSYAFIILGKWAIRGMSDIYHPIVLTFTGIFLSAWLMNTFGELLRRTQAEARRKAQQLASSEATLRTILDSMAEPMVVYGEDELITEANDQACAYFGYGRETLVGSRFRRLLFDDGTLPNKLSSLRARGEYHGETVVVSESGQEHTADMLVRSFVRDARRFYVALFRDITRQKELQEASRAANARLEQVNRELQQVNALRTAFYTTISQRLRSPLSAVLGLVELLLNQELGELAGDQHRALQSCRRSVLRIFELVDEQHEMDAAPEVAAAGQASDSGPATGPDEETRRRDTERTEETEEKAQGEGA